MCVWVCVFQTRGDFKVFETRCRNNGYAFSCACCTVNSWNRLYLNMSAAQLPFVLLNIVILYHFQCSFYGPQICFMVLALCKFVCIPGMYLHVCMEMVWWPFSIFLFCVILWFYAWFCWVINETNFWKKWINCLDCSELIQLLDEDQLPWKQSPTSSSLSSSSVGHWMLEFPSQCIVTTEAVLWERCVRNAIENQDKLELKACW